MFHTPVWDPIYNIFVFTLYAMNIDIIKLSLRLSYASKGIKFGTRIITLQILLYVSQTLYL